MRERLGIHRQRRARRFGIGALQHRAEDEILEGGMLLVGRIPLHHIVPPALELLFFLPVDVIKKKPARSLVALTLA